MKKIGNEIKTGLMIVMCILILVFLTIRTQGASAFKKGYNLTARFNYASGIKKGAPVCLTGVEVGEVKDVKIEYTPDGTKVTLSLGLEKSAKARQDSQAYIATMGLMGEKYLELTSGSKGSPFLENGSVIIGKEPMRMEEVMDKAMVIADNLDAGIGDLRKLTKDVNMTLVDNRAEIGEIIKNMDDTSKNFKEFSEDIKKNPWKLLIKTKEPPKGKPKKGE